MKGALASTCSQGLVEAAVFPAPGPRPVFQILIYFTPPGRRNRHAFTNR